MRLLFLLTAALAAGCATDDTREREFALLASLGEPQERALSELEEAVARGRGEVTIGFKNPGEARGVVGGTVVATPANVARAKADLKALNVRFDYEFVFIPAVLATISASQVAAIIANPRIDYLEPKGLGWLETVP